MSTIPSPNVSPEHLTPLLIQTTRFIDFSKRTVFLINQTTHTCLKLNRTEADIARQFTGKHSLGDILQNQLEHSGTTHFQIIFNLLIRLQGAGLLTKESAFAIRQHAENTKRTDRPSAFFGLTQRATTILRPANVTCSIKCIPMLVDRLTRPAFLVLWLLLAIVAIGLRPGIGSNNILLGFNVSPLSPVYLRYGSYTFTFLTLWAVLSLYFSLKNFLSACLITSIKTPTVQGHLRFFYGLIIFDIAPDEVVSTGITITARLFIARLLFPFVLAFSMTSLQFMTGQLPIVTLLSNLFLIIGFLSLSPILPGDLNKLLYLTIPDAGTLKTSNLFLLKRFLYEITNFRSNKNISDYYLFIAVAGIVWLYLFYVMLWSVIRGTLVYLLAEIGSGPLWGQILLGTYLLILIAPVIALFFSTLLIIAFNFRTTVQAPLRTMHKFAHRIARRSVTDSTQVVSFLQNIPLYAILDTKDLHQLCRHLTLMKTGRNSTILTLGEKGDAFYTIVSGCVEVIKEDASGAENIVETLATGDSFGEIALLEAVPRTATIRTREPTVLFKLEKKNFNTFIAEYVERRDKITDLIRMSRRIMNCPVFSQCTPKQVHAIVMHTERKIIEEGTTIFSQDEEGDRFYLIESGCIHLKRTEEGKTVWEKKVSDGDFFGEIALAKKIPRTASAIACSSASLLTLSGKDFYTIISSNLLSGIEIDTAAKRRLAQLGKEAACASS